jgi:CHAT domain-containing protein
MRVAVVAVTLLMFAPAAFAQDTRAALNAALVRYKDMESASRLSAEGQALFRAEAGKNGYQYCADAISLAERGHFREAIQAASKALFLGETASNDDLIAHAKRDLAMAYLYANELERAHQYAEESLKHNVRPNNYYAVQSVSHKTLGDVAAKRGDFAKAVVMYGKSIDNANGALKFYARAARAAAYVGANQLDQANKAVKDAESYISLVSPSYQTAAKNGLLRIRGALALKEGKSEDAVRLYEAAIAAQTGRQELAYEQFWAFEGLGRAKLAKNDKPGALQAYLDAISQSEKVRAHFRSEEVKTGLFGELQESFGQAVRLLMEAGQHEQAWEVSERGRARALLDLLRNRVQGGALPVAPPRIRDVVAALKPGEAVVSYHVLAHQTYGWAIRSTGVHPVTITVERDALSRQVEEYRNALIHASARTRDLGAKLHDVLIKPFALNEGESVAIIPHDVLHYLPFQALPHADTYLLERHAVSYAPSGGTLVALAGRPVPASGKLFALANPDLSDPAMALPGAQREVEAIRALFQESETYFGKDATRERLLKGPGQSRIIHVAAHASVDVVDPLHSKIYLARGTDSTGNVEAREVYSMKLDTVSLVALSACETGLGKVSRGDEIWGFTRSFLSAGAPSLMVSLWPVADESTEKLMKRFYAEMTKGIDRRRALQAAQLDVMRDPRFSAPYFWAAFNLVGDWR